LPKHDAEQRQGFAGISGVVRAANAADAAWFIFPANANKEWMPPRRLGRVKHRHRTRARRDHRTIGKADPLASVLIEELVADSPVGRFVLAPVRIDLPGDVGGAIGRLCCSWDASGYIRRLLPTFYPRSANSEAAAATVSA